MSWVSTPLDPYALRVTLVDRREDGEWKAVHRWSSSYEANDAILAVQNFAAAWSRCRIGRPGGITVTCAPSR